MSHNLMEKFIVEELNFFRDFDISNYISNGKSALSDKVFTLDDRFKFISFSKSIKDAIEQLEGVTIPNDTLFNFTEKMSVLPSKAIDNRHYEVSIYPNTITDIKPQYIKQFINLYKEKIDKLINGKLDAEDYLNSVDNSALYSVKKQISISGSVLSKKNFEKDVLQKTRVVVTDKFIKEFVMPFVKNWDDSKKNTIKESNNILNVIKDAEVEVRAIYNSLENIKTREDISRDVKLKVSQIEYNAIRDISEILSYTTMLVILKSKTNLDNIVVCNQIYDMICNNFYSESLDVDDLFQKNNIMPTDTNSLGEYFLNGDVVIFSNIVKTICEFYKNKPFDEKTTASIDEVLSSNGLDPVVHYDDSVYSDIGKALLSISSGLDVISPEGEELFMFFDDIVDRSGLKIPLEARFKGELANIERVSWDVNTLIFTDTNHVIYEEILKEVKDYPRNMETIANITKEVNDKITLLHDRFENSISEYKNTELIKELILFFDDFKPRFSDFINTIAKGYYDRLKSLSSVLDKLTNLYDGNVKEDSPEVQESYDFELDGFISYIEAFEAESAAIFTELEKQYVARRAKVRTGHNLVFTLEDGEEEKPAKTENDVKKNEEEKKENSNNTTSNNDNNKPKNSSLKNLVDTIINFINEKIKKFTNQANAINKNNKKFLDRYKEGLISRSYNNVSKEVLPYDGMKSTTITEDIGKLNSNINSLTKETIESFKTRSDVTKKLIPFVNNLNTDEMAKSITKYYKVGGTNNLEPVTKSNGDLKNFVVNEIIPYCESYINGYSKTVTDNLNKLTQTIQNRFNTLGLMTESVFEISDNVFVEDGESDDKKVTINTQFKLIKEVTESFTGAVLNAIRDRNTDYLSILNTLKKEPSEGNNDDNSEENTDNEEK